MNVDRTIGNYTLVVAALLFATGIHVDPQASVYERDDLSRQLAGM